MTQAEPSVDPHRFRQVLGNYPTGVAVITAMAGDGSPVGMAVGTFTSVSLDPPLVAFLPDRKSSSFPRIRTAASFCVNVLAADQEDVCRAFASRGGDKFAGIAWSPAPSGAPRLHGVAAWIDCDFESITDAGDHYLVMGRVRELYGSSDSLPLLFFQSGYGRFSPTSLIAIPEPDVIGQLRHADLARPALERIAAATEAECTAVAVVGDQLVVVAGAGTPAKGTPRTRVGQRSPFLPPLGALLVAAGAESAWLARAGDLDEGRRQARIDLLERARCRGWSLSLGDAAHSELERALGRYSDGDRSPETQSEIRRLADSVTDRFEPARVASDERYDVRLISAPVIDADGEVVLLLTLWGLPTGLSGHQITEYATQLCAAAADVSAARSTRA
jgi:flavin reductase (DIM6/NTAB) family NADH-FMN oxidoreductase RutF/DNA-binding IclR family transcriptional regulator